MGNRPSKTPTSFDATASVLERLYSDGHIPADAPAIVFAAVTTVRALDRLSKQIEGCADVLTGPAVVQVHHVSKGSLAKAREIPGVKSNSGSQS